MSSWHSFLVKPKNGLTIPFCQLHKERVVRWSNYNAWDFPLRLLLGEKSPSVKEIVMNKFSFENARVNKVWDNKNRFNLGILDTRAVAQPDGSYQSVFVASRIVTTANPDHLEFIRKNLVDTSDAVVNISGYMETKAGKKPGTWYDNLVITDIALA